jgi:hypothetical protein
MFGIFSVVLQHKYPRNKSENLLLYFLEKSRLSSNKELPFTYNFLVLLHEIIHNSLHAGFYGRILQHNTPNSVCYLLRTD